MKINLMKCLGSLRREAGPIELLVLAPIVTLLAGWGIVNEMGVLASRDPTPAPAPAASRESDVATLFARQERNLTAAWRFAQSERGDGRAWLRVATLELNGCDLMAAQAYEERQQNPTHPADDEHNDYVRCRERFLQTDPDGSLTRAVRAAEAALRAGVDPESRQQALLLLATARRGLGEYPAEVEALREAAHREPHRAEIWWQLSKAYGRAHRFAQAEAAIGRMAAVLEETRSP
jgi:tetratricopeptide (TPR) repeat protein